MSAENQAMQPPLIWDVREAPAGVPSILRTWVPLTVGMIVRVPYKDGVTRKCRVANVEAAAYTLDTPGAAEQYAGDLYLLDAR